MMFDSLNWFSTSLEMGIKVPCCEWVWVVKTSTVLCPVLCWEDNYILIWNEESESASSLLKK